MCIGDRIAGAVRSTSNTIPAVLAASEVRNNHMSTSPVDTHPLCSRYLRALITQQNKSEKTRDAYQMELALWAQYLASRVTERDIATATRRDIEDYLDFCRLEHGNSAVTVRRKLSSLKAFYKWAVQGGHLANSPAEGIQLPKMERRKARYLKKHEVRRLLNAVLEEPSERHQAEAWARTWRRDRAMIYVKLYQGLRISEVTRLDWSDIDMEMMMILVHGKGAKERRIPMHQVTLKILRELRQFGPTSTDSNGPVFLTTENPNPAVPAGHRLSTWSARRAIHKYIHAAGISKGITAHKLRHTFATMLLDAGADIRDIADQLGHESLEATKIYTHPTTERHRAMIDRITYEE